MTTTVRTPSGGRIRLAFVALAAGTIAVGLLVHRTRYDLRPAVRDVLGDALWAMMIAWWIGALAPRAATLRRGAVTLGVCVAVELSQLYHAPSIDAMRQTTFGHLVLGNDFDARDLAAYALGVIAAVFLERAARRRTER